MTRLTRSSMMLCWISESERVSDFWLKSGQGRLAIRNGFDDPSIYDNEGGEKGRSLLTIDIVIDFMMHCLICEKRDS